MTDAEHCLWQCLRDKQLDGFRFRKQHPIAHFVLDFYCPAVKLAIEIDGSQHNTAPGSDSDAERTRYLITHGIRVLRFWNHEVLQDLPSVLERIWETLHLPPPHLPPLGGGKIGKARGVSYSCSLIVSSCCATYLLLSHGNDALTERICVRLHAAGAYHLL
jgi:very-short-patch-repair endonuclease